MGGLEGGGEEGSGEKGLGFFMGVVAEGMGVSWRGGGVVKGVVGFWFFKDSCTAALSVLRELSS